MGIFLYGLVVVVVVVIFIRMSVCVCVCVCFLKTYKLIDRYDDECLGGLSPSLSLSHDE